MPSLGTLFSGCECVGVGFIAAGFTIAWYCEWDKRPSAVLRYRFSRQAGAPKRD